MPRTFISYESTNKSIAFKVCEYLEANGITCWIAPRDIHAGEYAGEITRALKTADNLVVICSPTTSKSPHVRNEVSLAFGSGCKIVPFVLKDVKLDDSLEYYFAGKQRVYAEEDIDEGLANLLSALTGRSGAVSSSKKNNHSFIRIAVAALILIAVIFSCFLLLCNKKNVATVVEERIDIPDTVSMETAKAVDIQPASSSKPAPSEISTGKAKADSFSGTIINGLPDGEGKYTFTGERRIDMHDTRERVAASGDYIIGEWDQGHLIQGKWYGSDGHVKEVIILGKAPNPESDQVLWKCAKQ